MKLLLASIRIDGGTQPRAELSADAVALYREEMEAGAKFPALVVFHDGTDHWLADGFHRFHAAKALGLAKVEVDVRQGTQREAVLFSVGANATHGLPRSNADKRRAVDCLLRDEEWGAKSDRWIAKACNVSHTFVAGLRPAPTGNVASSLGQDGKTRKRPEPKAAPAEVAAAASIESPAIPAEQPRAARIAVKIAPAAPNTNVINIRAREQAAETTIDYEQTKPDAVAHWSPDIQQRRVAVAMTTVRDLVREWPAGFTFAFLVSALRGFADTLEQRNRIEERSETRTA